MLNLKLPRALVLIAVGGFSLCAGACSGPSKVNIDLRKQIDGLNTQVLQLQRGRDADRATILGLQSHATTVPSLPQSRLDELFTVGSVQFGRLTGGYRPDPNVPGDTMLKVYVVPMDLDHQALKAAGSFNVSLFDLTLKANNKIGEWSFDLAASRAQWYGEGMLYSYVLDCPWQTPPVHKNLMIHVMFTDALTGRVFEVDRDVTVDPPVSIATRPAQ